VTLSLRLHQQAQHSESLQPKGAGACVRPAFVYQEQIRLQFQRDCDRFCLSPIQLVSFNQLVDSALIFGRDDANTRHRPHIQRWQRCPGSEQFTRDSRRHDDLAEQRGEQIEPIEMR
jgi:hypothetical protein